VTATGRAFSFGDTSGAGRLNDHRPGGSAHAQLLRGFRPLLNLIGLQPIDEEARFSQRPQPAAVWRPFKSALGACACGVLMLRAAEGLDETCACGSSAAVAYGVKTVWLV